MELSVLSFPELSSTDVWGEVPPLVSLWPMGVRISLVCHPTPTLTPLHSSRTFLLLLPVHTPLSSVTSLSCILLWLTSWRVLACLNRCCLWNSKAQFSGPEFLHLRSWPCWRSYRAGETGCTVNLQSSSSSLPPMVPACLWIPPSSTSPSDFLRHGVLFQIC